MIGVIVPAHDEEALIARCLAALCVAAQHPRLAGEPVCVLVVLDACGDRTAAIVMQAGVASLAIEERNVGRARDAGARRLLAAGARWLAFTDADSEVAPCWLAHQLALDADAVCGVVTVDDWTGYSEDERRCYEAQYADADGHPHIHGASLGVSASAYLRAGGFAALACHEDVALVRQLVAIGARIARTNTVRVLTSARRAGRAPEGFACFMDRLADRGEPAASAGLLPMPIPAPTSVPVTLLLPPPIGEVPRGCAA